METIDVTGLPEDKVKYLEHLVESWRKRDGNELDSEGAGLEINLEQAFQNLVEEWKAQSIVLSSVEQMALLPSYQRIIGLGMPVIPLILRELEKRPDHWFWALNAISGVNPVPEESRGNMREMAAAWIEWGREMNFIS